MSAGPANPFSAIEIEARRAQTNEVPTDATGTHVPWWASPFAVTLIGAILLYRWLYPVAWRRRCIYEPTCSAYGLAAVRKFGGVRGAFATWLRIKR